MKNVLYKMILESFKLTKGANPNQNQNPKLNYKLTKQLIKMLKWPSNVN